MACNTSKRAVDLSLNFTSNNAPWRAVITALIPLFSPNLSSPKNNSVPSLGDFDERICAKKRYSSSMRSTKTSIFPPLALRPNILAGITRVLLKINKSPSSIKSNTSEKVRSITAPFSPFKCNKRQDALSSFG